jgi:hypothetical protein
MSGEGTGSNIDPGTSSGSDKGGSSSNSSGNGSGSSAGLSGAFTVTTLTADQPGAGGSSNIGPFMVNAWGIVAYQGMFWIADEATGRVSILDGTGKAGTGKFASDAINLGEGITGVTVNDSTAMQIQDKTACGPANLIFASVHCQLIGVNTDLSSTGGFVLVDRSDVKASYTGVTTVHQANGNGHGNGGGAAPGSDNGQGNGQGGHNAGPVLTLAADFHNARIDVFDESFKLLDTPMFTASAQVPAGFAPFDVWAWNTIVYVTYAKQDADKADSVAGAGLGFVAAFDTSGKLLWTAQGNELNAPWGLAIGDQKSLCDQTQTSGFAGVLLVGNFGDGRITALDVKTGAVLGQLMDANRAPIAIDGLWGLAFGMNVQGAFAGGLYFTAGPSDEQHGMFGVIRASSTTTTPPMM